MAPRRTLWTLATLAAGVSLLAGCSSTPDAAPTASPSAPAAVCQAGTEGIPAEVTNLTINGQPFERYSTPLVVPYAGLGAQMPPDRPVYVKVEVTTNVAGAPVTFTASGGNLVDAITAQHWQTAPDTLKVIAVAGTDRCVATAYLFSTQVGEVELLVNGNTTNQGTTLTVVTVKEAARNLALATDVSEVPASSSFHATVAVADVFGNPVEGASVDLALAAKGPGQFASGSNTATVTTDSKGTSDIQIATSPGKGKSVKITANGDQQSCTLSTNSYACKANQPGKEFPAPTGPQNASVKVIQPSAEVVEPLPGQKYSAGETFDVVAQTTAVPVHTQASVVHGGLVVATGAVAKDGSLTITNVPADETNSQKSYSLVIGDTISKDLDIVVLPFGIIDYQRPEGRIDFLVTPGAFPAGTPIVLTFNDEVWKRVTIPKAREDFIISVKDRVGTYQVEVTRGGVTTEGQQPVKIQGLA